MRVLHFTQKFVLDTSALLRASNQIFEILQKENFLAIIPEIVLFELDRLKDNKAHKENRNAHKILQSIGILKNKHICKKLFSHSSIDQNKNDLKIQQCTMYHRAWLITEDKTFKITHKQTLNIKEFRDKFENYTDSVPNALSNELFYAIQNHDIKNIQALLKQQQIKINAYNNEGFTPLICAIKTRNKDIVESILQHKDIDLHKCDKSHLKMTPLAHIVQQDNLTLTRLLLHYGANAYQGSNGKNKGNTPFLMACWDNRKNALAIMELLLAQRISINQVDSNGYSALIKACIKGHTKIVRWLLERGADKYIRDFNNKDALTHAREHKHAEIIALLGGIYA